jgi:molybdate transport system regulatory protein
MPRLTIRIDLAPDAALGPGKIRLLEEVHATGSIRKAAVAMKMSYRRAWLLLKATQEIFGAPVVATATGGAKGGGARLTPLGRRVVALYRSVEVVSAKVSRRDMAQLAKLAGHQGRARYPGS